MSHEYDATVGQIGFRIILQLLDRDPITGYTSAANISAASTKEIDLQRPDGSTVTYTAGAVTFTGAPIGIGDGTDGYIEAQTTSGDFNAPGKYSVAGYIVDATTDGPSQSAIINVGPALR
jgi:hypothetical protein